jgi:hypothetical protein
MDPANRMEARDSVSFFILIIVNVVKLSQRYNFSRKNKRNDLKNAPKYVKFAQLKHLQWPFLTKIPPEARCFLPYPSGCGLRIWTDTWDSGT